MARRSYKTQMADACKKIAGDYKRYYAQMLALETGQSGSVLQDMKDTIAKQVGTLIYLSDCCENRNVSRN